MNRASSRRGLLVAVLVLLGFLAAVDLMRPGSWIKGFFGVGPATRQEDVIDTFRRRGLPIPDRTGYLWPQVMHPDTPSMPG